MPERKTRDGRTASRWLVGLAAVLVLAPTLSWGSAGDAQAAFAANDLTPPSVPTNLVVIASGSGNLLSWDAAIDENGVAAYRLYRGGVALATTDSAQTYYFDSTPNPNGDHAYSVTALDGSGNESDFSGSAQVEGLPGPNDPELTPQADAEAAAITTPGTFDNFNRTVANPYWGFGSSGFSWGTDNVSGQCHGYTSYVNGQQGVLTGSAGAGCAVWGYLLQSDFPGVGAPAPWKAPSWTFTGTFRVSDLAGSTIIFGFAQQVSNGPFESVDLQISATAGSVGTGVFGCPSVGYVWQANTTYSFKWVEAWGNQSRVRIWPSTGPEPNDWLLACDETGSNHESELYGSYFAIFYSATLGPTSAYFDDFSFGPAPILPRVPPPAETDHNRPDPNSGDGGDPVSTLTGALGYDHMDVSIPGRGPAIQFARSYNSNDTRVTTLGPGWTHSYNIRLTSPGDGTNDIVLVGPQGRSDRYVESGGAFNAPLGVHRTLIRNADETYTATDKAQTEWRFDGSGRLTQIRDRHGNASNLTYDSSGRLSTVSDPAGRGSLTLGYTNSLLTSVTDWASPSRSIGYQYDANGRLWRVTDREGKTTTFGYDGTSQRITTVIDARGNITLTTTYDAQGRVATQKDARGLVTGDVTTFDYVVNPDASRATTLTLPGTSLEPSFHPTLTDTYDANGWLTSRLTAPSSTATLTQGFAYDAAGNRTSVTDPRGNTTDFCYDTSYDGSSIAGAAANLTRVIQPAPEPDTNRPTSLIRYDAKNNVIQTIAPKGVPSGQTVTCTTDLSATSSTFVVDYGYDGAGVDLLSTTSRFTDPDGGVQTAITKHEYGDPANPGLVTRVVPPRGDTGPNPDYTYATTMSYYATGSQAGQLKDVTDALGGKTSYGYDSVGRVTSLVDPLGNAVGGSPSEHTTTYSFDKEDRVRFTTLPAPTTGQSGLVSETRYDEVGLPIVRIDAAGQVVTYAYDERNSLSLVKESPNAWTDPLSPPSGVITTEYGYDAGGNVTRVTRAKGDGTYERATDYAYDGRGLARQESQYPAWPSTSGSLVTVNAYDPTGNLITSVNPLGLTTTYGYDALDRLTSIDYSDVGTPDVVYGYDTDGNRTSMTDGTGTTTYTYDEADRLISVTSPGPQTVGYRYDLDGNRTKLIYPDGTAVTYTIDKAGQLASLQDWASRSVAYTYYPDGAVRDATNPNGTETKYNYDNDRRLTNVSYLLGTTQLAAYSYSFDPVGNVIRVLEGATGARLTERVSVSTAGAQGNGWSSYVTPISADGRLVAFGSQASNLVAGDTNGGEDVFVRDRQTGTTSRVSVDTAGSQANGSSFYPAMTPDGRYVAFDSLASNLVSGDTNNQRDVFLRDQQSGTTIRVSVATGGSQAKSAASNEAAINATGRYVAFASAAKNLVSGDTNNKTDIFVRDTQTGTTVRASVTTGGAQANGSSSRASVSADGRFVAFASDATNLVTGDTNGTADIFVRDLQTGTTSRVSVATGGAQGNGACYFLAISGDGRYVAFDSEAPNLVSGDTNGTRDVFVRDVQAGTTIRVSIGPDGAQGNSSSQAPAISADGRYVVFDSYASNFVTGDTNGGDDLFVRDVQGGTTALFSVATDGAQGNGLFQLPSISADGRVVAYQSESTNLVPGDTNGVGDVFVSTQPPVEVTSYGYDRLYRLLTSVGGPDGPRSYTYDPAGNRLTKVAGATTAYTYDRADRLLSAGATAITVDANGNLTAKGADTFGFDQANRLTDATVAGASEAYTYDGDGTRFSRQVGADPAIRYVSDVAAGLPSTIEDGTRKYVYGLGLAYADSGGAIEVYHADRLGSVRALTNGAGTVTATYRSDEWGLPTTSTGSSSQPFGFTGEPRDSTGLTYLRARYYDPALGRFTSRDTWTGSMATSGSQNRYAYVTGNPATLTDPSGRCLVDTVADVGFLLFDLFSLATGPEKDRAGNWLAFGADLGGAALPCVTGAGVIVRLGRTAERIERSVAVLGRYPDYLRLADATGAKVFNIPKAAWEAMSEAERWAANRKFLDELIAEGDDILLASPITDGGTFPLEVDYLLQNGYLLSPDGWKLLAP